MSDDSKATSFSLCLTDLFFWNYWIFQSGTVVNCWYVEYLPVLKQ